MPGGDVRNSLEDCAPSVSCMTFVLGVLVAPLAAAAQLTGKVYRIGYISGGSPSSAASIHSAFRQGLRELGYVEGQDPHRVPLRRGEPEPSRTSQPPFVQLQVDVIIAAGEVQTRAAMRATQTIPIIMVIPDPIGAGFVASLARPGGNVTGVAGSTGRDFGGNG